MHLISTKNKQKNFKEKFPFNINDEEDHNNV